MDIIYISSTCSRRKYAEYIESKGAGVSQQAQKYNLLLAEGLRQNGADVMFLSTRPINRGIDSRLWFRGEKETVNGIRFRYIAFINYPVLRNLCIFGGVLKKIFLLKGDSKQRIILCDALNIVASLAAVSAAKLRNWKTIGIVTDVPGVLSYNEKMRFYEKVNLFVMKRFSGYLLLTEQMNQLVNKSGKPYIVLEGHADQRMEFKTNDIRKKYRKNVCLYAGSLLKVYGIQRLTEGFLKANLPDTELHIYGDGEYAEELKGIVKENQNIKYFGTVPNNEVVEAELKATLLINPRPTTEEFTKYSFPSKNMEYMASGTPVLTTDLPGMPADHRPYVFMIKEETADGIATALKEVFSLSREELYQKGMEARRFILREKNHVKQAKKVLDFMNQFVRNKEERV